MEILHIFDFFNSDMVKYFTTTSDKRVILKDNYQNIR
jgi:hypothetical protein